VRVYFLLNRRGEKGWTCILHSLLLTSNGYRLGLVVWLPHRGLPGLRLQRYGPAADFLPEAKREGFSGLTKLSGACATGVDPKESPRRRCAAALSRKISFTLGNKTEFADIRT
jgi:hypothetical protein